MKRNILYILMLLAVALTSCNEYARIQKSTDNDLKFSKAKEYYEKGKYLNAASLLESVVQAYRGSEKGEESLFLLAQCYLKNRDYLTARTYFAGYYRSYSRGAHAETAKFNVGYCYYKDSPEVKLDQTSTKKAIEELELFIELFPNSIHVAEAKSIIQEMTDKLAYKAYLNARLYFRLGNYMGNNYLSATIAASNAIKAYPESIYREELSFLILKSKFLQAEESVKEKQEERYRETIDEYYSFMNDYPESKHAKEAKQMLEKSMKHIKRNNKEQNIL